MRPSIRIGEERYPLGRATLSTDHSQDGGEHFLTVGLLADTADLTEVGFAIDWITWRGHRRAEDLAGICFCLRSDSPDPLNELCESVICRPGEVLELEEPTLEFGRPRAARLPVRMRAARSGGGGGIIPVSASFRAEIEDGKDG